LSIELSVCSVVTFGARWKFQHIVRMDLVACNLIVFVELFFVILVDFGFDIDELIAWVSSPALSAVSLSMINNHRIVSRSKLHSL